MASCWNVGKCGAFSVQAFVCAVRFLSVGPFVGVAISCMYLVLVSLFLELFSVAKLQLLTMGLWWDPCSCIRRLLSL